MVNKKDENLILELLKNLDGKIDTMNTKLDKYSYTTDRLYDDMYGDVNTNKTGVIDKVKNLETSREQVKAAYWIIGVLAGIVGFFIKVIKP